MTTNPSTGLPEELEKIDPKELRRLSEAANDALFSLHDYLRRNMPPADERWRDVYGCRVKIGWLTDGLLKLCAASVLREGK